MKFPYKRYTVDSSSGTGDDVLYRPMVPLRVIGTAGDVFFWALLDTGADRTILPRAIAEAIGVSLDEDHAQPVAGFGGQHVAVVSGDVTMQIGDGRQTFEWDAAVGFAAFDDPEEEVAILGHTGCLDFFRATFDGDVRQVELVPTGSFPGIVH